MCEADVVHGARHSSSSTVVCVLVLFCVCRPPFVCKFRSLSSHISTSPAAPAVPVSVLTSPPPHSSRSLARNSFPLLLFRAVSFFAGLFHQVLTLALCDHRPLSSFSRSALGLRLGFRFCSFPPLRVAVIEVD